MEAKDEKEGIYLDYGYCSLSTGCLTARKQGSETEYSEHLNAAIKYFQQENYSLARQELNLALRINPRSARANNLLGLTYFKEGNYDSAEIYFQRAIRIDPGYATGYLNLGAIYAMRELYPKAREYYEKLFLSHLT